MSIDTTHSSADRRSASDVHVVGGGLAGLVAAAVVARAGHTVTVHESRQRLGGRATTDERHGYRFNQGPHAFYRGGEAERVLATLGIRPGGAPPPASAARMTLGGELHIAPGSARTLARTRLLGRRDKVALANLLRRLPKIDPTTLAGTSTRFWIDSITDRERVRMVLRSLVRLTSYADAPDHLSADVAARQLQRGLGAGVIYLDRGWGHLVERLGAMKGVEFDIGQPITDLDQLQSGAVAIVATGSPAAAAVLTGHEYAAGPEATVATLDIGLHGPPELSFVIGVDEPRYLSNHGVAAGMVPEGAASLSLAEYRPAGTSNSDEADGSPTAARDRLRRFAAHAGVSERMIVEERYLHRMTTVTSLATPDSGGLDGRPGVAVPGRSDVFVAGDWVGRRGHLADAVVASAEEAAVAAIRHIQRRPVQL